MSSKNKIQENKYVLGVDIGTTSVKITVLNVSIPPISVKEEHSLPTDAYLYNDNGGSEQNVLQIVSTLEKCIQRITKKVQEQIIGIGVCGQMHGVTCWSSADKPWSITKCGNENVFNIDHRKISPLYTWQDGRCDPKFLRSLPDPDSHLSVHTGYGCCTLFWLTRKSPSSLSNYNCACTIADFIVSMFCDLDSPLMCTQNAASWGYFNTETNEWNVDILKKHDFPVRLLPKIVQPKSAAGCLKQAWHRIPAGVPVGVALGDLHSYVYAVMENDNHAIVNISTSAQLVHVEKDFHPRTAVKSAAKIVPYFDGKYLYEAALLNGGNSLSLFVSRVHECLHGFGCEMKKGTCVKYRLWARVPKVDRMAFADHLFLLMLNALWKKLIEQAFTNEAESDLVVIPCFLGERYDPDRRASISNITPENLKLAQIFRSFCKGLIANFHEIVSADQLKQKGINRIIGSGSGLLKNKVLQLELEKQFPLPVEYKRSGDSPYGAALCMHHLLSSQANE